MKKYPVLRLTPAQQEAARELGRIGGNTRAANLSHEERQRIAIWEASHSRPRRKLERLQQGPVRALRRVNEGQPDCEKTYDAWSIEELIALVGLERDIRLAA